MSTITIPLRSSIPRSAWLLAALGALVVLGLLAVLAGSQRAPASPFNGRIVFGRFDAALGDTVIYAVNPDGSHLVKLRPEVHEGPHWSPDGRRIGMVDAVMNADGSGYRARDFSQGSLTLMAWDWSPDGKRLLMEGFNDAITDVHGVYTVRASDGGDLIRLTKPGDAGVPAAYSPDGSTVLWVLPSADEGPGAMMLVGVDGSNERRLGTLMVNWDPTWAPDGRSVLASSSGRLYSIDVTTGRATQIRIKDAPEAQLFRGMWSPDGTRILIKRYMSGQNNDLFTMLPDGTDLVRVTNDPDDDRFYDWGVHPLE
jgi:Tol biopolymer transport system component